MLAASAKVAIGTAAVALATVAAWPSAAPAPKPPRAPHVQATERATPQPTEAAQPAAPAEAQPNTPSVAPEPAPAPAATAIDDAAPKRSAAAPAGAADRREIAQLARIKALVDVDPAQAYRLAQQGDRQFARGMLREERQALAIAALAHAGRTGGASSRLRAFVARYPNSPAREHLEQLLGAERE
jgi:hypothetical protein